MADNTPQNGTDTISTDDLGTVKVQRVKNQFGVDGSATDVAPLVGLPTAPQQSSTATIAGTSPTIGSTSGSLLGSNTARKGAVFYNDTNVDVLVALDGGTATVTHYSLRLSKGGYYELPVGSVYTGAITGVGVAVGTVTPTAAVSGNFCVTELS